MKKYLIVTASVFAFFAMVGISHAANITWTGGGADNNWGTSGNWSTNTVPGGGDTAIFSGSSTKNCTINTAVNVLGLTIGSGYTGGLGSTITQSSGESITVGSSGYTQAAGTFTGSSNSADAITVNGIFSQTGGTFTSTAGTLTLISSATSTNFTNGFAANGGTVVLEPNPNITQTITGSSTFNNLTFTANGGSITYNIATGTTLTTSGTLALAGQETAINGSGLVNALGNITSNMEIECDVPSCGGTGTIALVGSSTQSIVGLVTTSTVAFFPNIVITKASGSVNLTGIMYVGGNWTNTNGTTISAGTSTMIFYQTADQVSTITGSSTFNNLTFLASDIGGTDSFVIATNTLIVASGTLNIGASTNQLGLFGGGQLNALGNVSDGSQNYCGSTQCGGTVTLALVGTGTQTITGTTEVNGSTPQGGFLPNILITKTSGAVNLADALTVVGSWANTNGTTINPGTSTVYFFSQPNATTTVTGSSTFDNLFFEGPGEGLAGSYVIATGTTITANGQLGLGEDDNDFALYGGGEVDALGNIYLEGTTCYQGIAFCGGTATLGIKGSGSQTIVGLPQGTGLMAYTPQIVVNKPWGTAEAIGGFEDTGSLTITSGQLSLNANTSSPSGWSDYSIGPTNSSSIVINGATSISSGAALSDYASASGTLTLGGNITNNGLIFFDGSGCGCLAAGSPSNVIVRSTNSGTQRTWSGTGTFVMRYTDLKDQATTVPITVVNGVNTGNNTPISGAGWTFSTGTREALIQSVSNAGSGTSLALPQFGFWPRDTDLVVVAVSARNQSISAPTDNASNTYALVATSTIGSDSLALYYAKNIVSSSTFIVTVHGGGGSSPLLTASAFEYTDMAPSTTLDSYISNTDNSGTATTLTSGQTTGHSSNEVYFGTMTLAASTTATNASGWTSELGTTNNTADQALYNEDIATSSLLTTSATWTTSASSSYGAILAVFHSPFGVGYAASGTLDSATFDTGVTGGAQLNSLVWQGNEPASTAVDFQIAVSNSSSGPWTFVGQGGSTSRYFSGGPATTISFGQNGSGYSLFSGYRYFKYRVTLFSDPTQLYTPMISGVTVNWSP